ncbi:MAG: transglycosylase domain-containing protein [Dysgonamonadaceae bacterium]|nr:transglycosylase domain-containing protein [Dysgonamonadaceae bacterium]MDD4729209.1 transglycosylase domain-containing protein [Dysgonamonadaceae bacterium]
MGKKKESTKKSIQKQRTFKQKVIKTLWVAFGGIILLSILLFGLIAVGAIGYIPPIDQLENPIDKYASQLYSSNGEVLSTYSLSKENRVFVNYSELSPHLINALIATEDIRFYSHSGIDVYALARAVIKRGIFQQKSGGGGSTITQQLAKLLYSPSAANAFERILQKPIEWVIAVKLERFYTKEEILNLYLNKYDFNYDAVGIMSAAKTYFDKLPSELNIEESAMLVGMCKNSSLYNPLRRPELTQQRRNVVLLQLEKSDHISKSQKDSLQQIDIKLEFNRSGHREGLAPYFRQYLAGVMMSKKPERKNYRASWLKQQYIEDSISWENDPLYGWCYKNIKSDGSYYNIYTDGLKIYSTIDSRMQKHAEDAVKEHVGGVLQPQFTKEKEGRSYAPYSNSVSDRVEGLLIMAMKQTGRYRDLKKEGKTEEEIINSFKTETVDMKIFSWEDGEAEKEMTPWDSIKYHKGFLRAGFMAMNPVTGHVKAYVGGPNFSFFQYDMVTKGKRQIGSTIKPFLYTLAMEEGMTPCDRMLHVAQTLTTETGELWTPRNPGAREVGESVSIKWGLQNSSNWVTAYLMKLFSPYAFARLLHSFGLESPIDPVVSLALGPCDASVEEMVKGYSAFVNRGIRVDPLYLSRIEDSHGNIISTFVPQMREIFSESASFKMLDMLRSVVDGGTGGRLRFRYNLKGQMGGKTGTTQNNSDGWFMSFTPEIVAGAWVGGEERAIHFDNMAQGQGASMALPIHGLFYQKIYADKELTIKDDGVFEIPSEYQDPCYGADRSIHDYEDYQSTKPSIGIDDMFD